jgi:hypothetical protein
LVIFCLAHYLVFRYTYAVELNLRCTPCLVPGLRSDSVFVFGYVVGDFMPCAVPFDWEGG